VLGLGLNIAKINSYFSYSTKQHIFSTNFANLNMAYDKIELTENTQSAKQVDYSFQNAKLKVGPKNIFQSKKMLWRTPS
jgi:hypothetical protein